MRSIARPVSFHISTAEGGAGKRKRRGIHRREAIDYNSPMKILAILLSIWLAAPLGWAAERAAVAQETRVPPADSPAAPQPQPLTEDEAARLAERDEEPGEEVAGGALSNLHLTYAVIALATAVLVLIAVK